MNTTQTLLSHDELSETWSLLSTEERLEGFHFLAAADADEFFLTLTARDQVELLLALPPGERRSWVRLLAPDDAADVIQEAPPDARHELLAMLDGPTRAEVSALLAYAEDAAGGLMNPCYARLRPEMSVNEAISYLRCQARERGASIYYVYVLDTQQKILGVVSFRELFAATGDKKVQDVMRTNLVTATEETDPEALSLLFAQHHFLALPIVDAAGRVKGVVTIDDIVDVVHEEATEDMHKLGGLAALEAPYLQIGFTHMVRKRAGWLSALFIGEMLTATAMSYFAAEIERAVVLALFIPLIISSGGNSGSQASTLVIRAMALGEVRLPDWWRVIRREVFAGVALGSILGAIGLTRILLWPTRAQVYGEQYLLIAFTVACSLVGVVLFGTIAGSMLPFILRRFGFDPASASAPFVATLVDVTGLIIYFTMASVILGGVLL